jgi:hypothetical protein
VRCTFLLGLLVLLSSCTVYHGGVKDVTLLKDGGVALEKCDLKVYLAFYGLVTSEDNCRTETKVAFRTN